MTSEAFERWRRDAKTFHHRDHAISYHVEGEGPSTLLAVHGFPSASWDWHPMWAALTARFRVVALDMIGFGWSDKPRDYDYSILDQASIHEALLRHLGIGRVHVLAHDYGDTVVQELLARGAPIESVCFLNGGLFPETHHPRLVQRVLASPFGRFVGPLTTKRAFSKSLRDIFGPRTPPTRDFVDQLWTLLRHADGHRVVHLLIGYMAERREHRERWVGALQHAKVPLRLVDGMRDPVSGAHMVARYRELVPNADVVELADVGHYPQVEDPPAVLRAFFAFHDRDH